MVSLNLIPKTLQLARARRRRIRGWSLPILLAGTVLTVPLLIDWYRRAEAAQLRVQNDQLQTQLAANRAELRTLTFEAKQALVRLERAKALRSKRAWSAVLVMLGKRMPEGCWLTSIATDPPVPSHAPPRVGAARNSGTGLEAESSVTIDAPRKLRITGYATDAAQPHQFVTNLKKATAFTGVALETSRREPVLDGSYFRFELACEW